jgi:hypothetical protein
MDILMGPDTDIQKARRKQLENRAWFDAHAGELIKQHPGKPVAIHNGEVIATGENENKVLVAARQKAKQEGWMEEELLFIMVPTKEVVHVRYPGGED